MWDLDHKESWVLKSWCFHSLVLEMTLESSWNSKQIKPVSAEGNQPWIFIGRADSEAEAPVLWPLDVKSWLTGKDSDAGKIEGRMRRVWQKMRQVASLTQWTWIWANSWRSWRTVELGMLRPMGSQRFGHDLVTEKQEVTKHGYFLKLCQHS